MSVKAWVTTLGLVVGLYHKFGTGLYGLQILSVPHKSYRMDLLIFWHIVLCYLLQCYSLNWIRIRYGFGSTVYVYLVLKEYCVWPMRSEYSLICLWWFGEGFSSFVPYKKKVNFSILHFFSMVCVYLFKYKDQFVILNNYYADSRVNDQF